MSFYDKPSERVIQQINMVGCGCEACAKRAQVLKPAIDVIAKILDETSKGEESDPDLIGLDVFAEMTLAIAGTLIELNVATLELAASQSSMLSERLGSMGRFYAIRLAVENTLKDFIRDHFRVVKGGIGNIDFDDIIGGGGGSNGGDGGPNLH